MRKKRRRRSRSKPKNANHLFFPLNFSFPLALSLSLSNSFPHLSSILSLLDYSHHHHLPCISSRLDLAAHSLSWAPRNLLSCIFPPQTNPSLHQVFMSRFSSSISFFHLPSLRNHYMNTDVASGL